MSYVFNVSYTMICVRPNLSHYKMESNKLLIVLALVLHWIIYNVLLIFSCGNTISFIYLCLFIFQFAICLFSFVKMDIHIPKIKNVLKLKPEK